MMQLDMVAVYLTPDEVDELDTATEDFFGVARDAMEALRFLGWENDGSHFEAANPGILALQRLAALGLEAALARDGKSITSIGRKVRLARSAHRRAAGEYAQGEITP